MQIVKRCLGAVLILFAIGILLAGLGTGREDGKSLHVLDSPEASGRLLGTMIPVLLFGTIGVWFMFSKKQRPGRSIE